MHENALSRPRGVCITGDRFERNKHFAVAEVLWERKERGGVWARFTLFPPLAAPEQSQTVEHVSASKESKD